MCGSQPRLFGCASLPLVQARALCFSTTPVPSRGAHAEGIESGALVGGGEDAAAGHEHIGARVDEFVRVLAAHSAIHRNVQMRTTLAQRRDLCLGRVHVLGPPVARVDEHDDHDSALVQHVFHCAHWRRRIQHNARGAVSFANEVNHGTQLQGRLGVDRDDVSASPGKIRDAALGLEDSELDVEDCGGELLAACGYDGRTEADLGDHPAICDSRMSGADIARVRGLARTPGGLSLRRGGGEREGPCCVP